MSLKKIKPLLIALFIILLIWGGFSLFQNKKRPQIVEGKEALYQTSNTGNFKAQFGLKENQKKIVFSTKNSSIAIEIPTEKAEWIKEGEKLKVTQGPVDFIYSILQDKDKKAQGIKEEIILNKRVNTNLVFQFPINLNNLTPKKEDGIWHFYNDNGEEIFYIPKPFMVDNAGNRSERINIRIEDNSIKVIPDTKWLQEKSREYPVNIDPSLKLTVLDVHSHPQTGDTWSVSFETEGEADLKIIPADQATIDDLEFTSLKCGENELDPQILEGDVIYYPNWNCEAEGEVNHYVKKEGEHKLRFEFGDEVAFAYNNPDAVTDTFSDETKISSMENTFVDSSAGTMKLQKTGFCNDEGDVGTSTIDGDIVYCDSNYNIWTPTLDLPASSSLQVEYIWSNSCYGTTIGADSMTDGYSNTQTILNNCETTGDYIAPKCDSLTYAGYSDWYVPARDPLCNLGKDACGWSACDGNQASCTPSWDSNAQANAYWSSSEDSNNYAYYLEFSNGDVSTHLKYNDFYIRCVRGQ